MEASIHAAPAENHAPTPAAVVAVVGSGGSSPSAVPRLCFTAATIARASSALTLRLEPCAKMRPRRSAPASAASSAASAVFRPHTFTSGRWPRRGAAAPSPSLPRAATPAPRSSRMSLAGSAARISASPTRTPVAPPASAGATSSALETPERETSCAAQPGGIMRPRRVVVLMSTVNVCRLRLLTPITSAPAASAASISSGVFTSTSGSKPRSRAAAMRRASSLGVRIATMSSAVSAPYARACSSWYSSMRKSLRSTATDGQCPCAPSASRTEARSSRLPLNQWGSVSTLTTLHPALA
mmetsp:Transcript_21427/g.66478  ORF Transcript_21427/g.66478 Transcript_21427/m.66478 type:complete len:298 (+) Transcript_21427:1735-2628(+)